MAAAARCLRSLGRSSNNLKISSYIVKNTSQRSLNNATSSLLKSFLNTDCGLIKGSRSSAISTYNRINFSKRFAPTSFVCNLVQTCPLSIDGGVEVSGALDGNLGDDDGDTWSQNDDEPYIRDT
ncbi:uncharacterized protein LOC141889413 [Acropora palmata]|uniref:uncharacterized protein LOC141889413 n=1 Tax=Acropora palmata TaxID=6131 RepID=UPI003DA04A47